MRIALVLIAGWCLAAAVAEANEAAAVTAADIEADWMRQAEVRDAAPAAQGTVTPADDAAGAVDGVKDGRWGFHTENEDQPWWQVDLGATRKLDRAAIYNRCDECAPRNNRIRVLLSDDGQRFEPVYEHHGAVFFGASDDRPLVVPLEGRAARWLRLQLPGRSYFHLDEVEVFAQGDASNIALGRPAMQSSVSQWSARSKSPGGEGARLDVANVVARGVRLADCLAAMGVDVREQLRRLRALEAEAAALPAEDAPRAQALFLEARWIVRRMALANPLLDFDDLLFVKRAPGIYSHMSDQYYGWWSRPGGGLFVLKNWKSDATRRVDITPDLPPGNYLRPDLSHDGKRVLFAYCRHYPGLSGESNKFDKDRIPEDAFYHLYEMELASGTARRLTHGKYDDFDGRYLPDGRIVFLSTRRGRHVQYTAETAEGTCGGAAPDSYVRCGGGPSRPVAVYTLHVMDASGENLRPISAFENFEWTPSVDHHGRILFARWDYVDRGNQPYMSLWATSPDGANTQAVYGNYTRTPLSIFEARPVPGSRKMVFTASAHHSITAGSICLLDVARGVDGLAPLTRLTPEVCFPESEGWPETYFCGPYPLSEQFFLVSWSDRPLRREGQTNEPNQLGLYLLDAFGNLELIYRDAEISSETPLPLRSRPLPNELPPLADWFGEQEARLLLVNAYEGLRGAAPGEIARLRIVGIPAKTHPTMNHPVLGVTREDPGKFVLGTVPVERDGSAYFRVPSGVPFFLQALDRQGMAVQTMRSAVYLQPGQILTCVGCHEPRTTAPPAQLPLAALAPPARLRPGPEGSWPYDFSRLVQPVLEDRCVACHRPGEEGGQFDLSQSETAYWSLVRYGSPSLADYVTAQANQGFSTPGEGPARTSALLKLLDAGHYEVQLTAAERVRLITWMDTYAQRLGHFDDAQAEELLRLREAWRPLLDE